MPFSFSTFGTLLSEFQKYLSDRIPKAVYYSIGLVFVVLGILVGYIIGWSTIEKDWNHRSESLPAENAPRNVSRTHAATMVQRRRTMRRATAASTTRL